MPHEQLWAPWRLGYIVGDRPPPAEHETLAWLPGANRDCFLCRAVAGKTDRDSLVVDRGETSFVILNRFPYNNGHLLVAPLRHAAELADLADAEHLELHRQITRFVEIVTRRMNAEGFNVGLNLGRVAGAGLPGHLHWHVVPRWSGDSNFMSSVDAVRVIPQALDELWKLLREDLGSRIEE